MGENWFDNYSNRREKNNLKGLAKLREKQYKIDSLVLKKYLHSGQKVLDVGCSIGRFIYHINKVNKNLNLFGIDIDGYAISKATKDYGHIANFKKQNILNINNNIKFDIVVFRGTFQYLDNELHSSINHLKKIIKKDGRIIIFSLPSTDSFLYKILGQNWALFHPEMSLMFNEFSFRYLIKKHGLEIKKIIYPYLEDAYSNLEKDYKM